MSGDVVQFPLHRVVEHEGCFRAFSDDVKGEVVILPCVRIERCNDRGTKIRIESPATPKVYLPADCE
jgi:hypothetical protein